MFSNFKILLLTVYSFEMNEALEEIGICSLTAFLREKGCQVTLLGYKENKIDFQRIVAIHPDLIGLPVYGQSKTAVYQFCRQIRQMLPEVHLCVGGFLPTYYGEEMMAENPMLDFAVQGEGELVLWELVSRLARGESPVGIQGLISRNSSRTLTIGSKPELISDINTLPFPSRDLLRENKLEIAQISNSRGCFGHCTFCCCANFWTDSKGCRWRGRDIKLMLDEVETIIKQYGVHWFYFIDNSFEDPGANFQKVWNIATEILKRGLDIAYYLCFRAEFQRKMTPELLALLKQSGLCNVYLGIEAGNETDLGVYGKIATLDDNTRAIEQIQQAGINITIGFINFNPYSTLANLRRNIDFLDKYGFASHFPQLRRVRVFKGTQLFEKIVADGLLKDGVYDDEYKYDYIDTRVRQLVDFLMEYFRVFNRENANFCQATDFYANDFLAMVVYYRQKSGQRNQTELFHKFMNIENNTKEVLNELNRINALWFKEILDLAAANWNETAATAEMKRILTQSLIHKSYRNLEMLKAELFRNIAAFNATVAKVGGSDVRTIG